MAVICSICGEPMTSGRKCQHTGDLICDSPSCAGEYFLNNTNSWGK